MRKLPRNIKENEVISIPDDNDNMLISHPTYKASELLKRLKRNIHNINKWLDDEGVSCEILSPNQNWQKGKVKICLQFIPDESESVLDDIREGLE